ncbi:hypothetical protein CMQ_7174 [Grosmannia clavigera kw1407]|uniref:Uncharacterized protein n=1 Tax=Grosmannia clavigera (strain kw1407 / UAMH 11150) TaxID=655863 RepID=F0XPS5_GROCL|nr:uncharacterized protein CMQ_7174 [Grosmannia clavigera kw1407]EFX00172.1 hypothetical protein CMQ_7174 [Grosmannia clavigera kw1407]
MPNYSRPDGASNVLAWSAHTSNMQSPAEEDGAEVDEPPDQSTSWRATASQACHSFQKTLAYRPRDNKQSLLTKALQSQSEDENVDSSVAGDLPRRRCSMTSNTSMTSTAEFTSDTGFTTPPRTSSPSPRLLETGATPLRVKSAISFATPTSAAHLNATPKPTCQNPPAGPSVQTQQRKRCISFACANPKPTSQVVEANDDAKPSNKSTSTAAVPSINLSTNGTSKAVAKTGELRRPCIKFACPTRPSTESHRPHLSALKADGPEGRKFVRKPSPAPEPRSPTSFRKHSRGNSSNRSPRSMTRSTASRPSSHSPLTLRSKKYLTAKPEDLNRESSRFHEFASDAPLEDDWIRHAKSSMGQRITINDTLKKELAIRLLAKEAEEEAEQEEEDEEDAAENDDDDDDDEEYDDEDEDEDDDEDVDENDTVDGDGDRLDLSQYSGYNFDTVSDGYNTDNEVGFASSDDEDDGLVLWTVRQSIHTRHSEDYRDIGHSTLHQGGSPIFRRLSVGEHSDSSAFVAGQAIRQDKPKNRELAGSGRPATPELPDSTDFVCGTFDEDRPLEEAYMCHMAARKREKYQTIPQDIDPSFPTSDVEGESDDDQTSKYPKQKQQQGSADDQLWLHGELEDLHGEPDRSDRCRKMEKSSRRYRSPPPPKARGRSPAPRHLFDRQSPSRRMRSPAPKLTPAVLAEPPTALVSSRTSPVEIAGVGCVAYQAVAFRPGLTQTKSLPRPAAIFRHQQQNNQAAAKPARRPKANGTTSTKPMHIRGALDIVKGLEQKRQRRKEKFQQKYCNRARKGQALERRPQRGEGAERMRELGLLMAGKIGQGHYVISV